MHSRIDRSFSWLGRFPLAVDLADTVRLVGGKEVELLVDEQALSRWVAAELPRHPEAAAARGRLPEVLDLRNAVRHLLHARAEGDPVPPGPITWINHISKRSPSFTRISHEGRREVVEVNEDPFSLFSAAVARSTIDILDQGAIAPAVCRAPSCGMLFVPASRRQRWCSPQCGNRARVARHAAKQLNI